MMSKSILLINGPNLSLLGTREPERYGKETLDQIVSSLDAAARRCGSRLSAFQSNAEDEIVARIHQAAADGTDFILINPAAYTHTSVAIRDALSATRIPFIEIHLTNVHARETFRQRSYLSDLAVAVVTGLGAKGYELALDFALDH